MDSFEHKRAKSNYELVWARISKMSFSGLKEAHFESYMQGWNARALFERQHSLSNENESSPSDAFARETVGAIRRNEDGITTSD